MNARITSGAVWGAFALAFASAACAAPRAAAPADTAAATSTTSAALSRGHATASLALAVRAEEDDAEDDPRGTLIVGGDVIARCESVRAVHVNSEDTMAWLHILKSVAHCMNEGELRDRHLVLRGPTRPQILVKYMLSRLGITEDRVDATSIPGEATCATTVMHPRCAWTSASPVKVTPSRPPPRAPHKSSSPTL